MINIKDSVANIAKQAEIDLKEEFEKIDIIYRHNSQKVLNAFIKNNVSDIHFNMTTGYGYNDVGRDVIEKVFADILGSEDALVRNQFISGSHALSVTLFGLLRPNDILLSITGKPYDTLDEVIGIKENQSSLKSYGVKYEQIDLVSDDFDYDKINNYLKNNKVKVIEIQRSKGYSSRKSIDLVKLQNVIESIRKVDEKVIVMIDNCYCEFVEEYSPIEVGADIIVGSLIKNLGGGIAPNGAYIAGRKDLIKLCAERLTLPGQGAEVGPSLGINKQILQGLFFAPMVVNSALKTSILASYMLEKLGYLVEPRYNENRCDIVLSIHFNDKEKLIKFCHGIQESSPIDSNVIPIAAPMPGYDSEVIMAAGTFIQGSSIELTCDGPLRSPFIGYLQGGLIYEYGRLGVINAISKIVE